MRPARAFGAPQTTWIGAPAPVSTDSTCSLSASGCFAAVSTFAMMNGFSTDLSSTLSTSRPIMVRRSTISSSEASVSRCSLSQESVNFILVFPWKLLAQAAEQGRQVERTEAIVRQTADIGVEEGAQVRHAGLTQG